MFADCQFIASYQKFLLVQALLLYTNIYISNGGLLERDDEADEKAYACLTKPHVAVRCGKNEIITISQVSYGAEPSSCGTTFTERNDCLQFSETVTSTAKAKCDGEKECNVLILPLNDNLIVSDGIIGEQNGCGIGGRFHQLVFVNYMVVKYSCQAFQFCSDISQMDVKGLSVATADFPSLSVTNPTCECTFTSKEKSSFIQATALCNGTVTFVVEETIASEESNGREFVTVTNRYHCNDPNKQSSFSKLGTEHAVALKVSVDASNSSEYSAYTLYMATTVLTNRDGAMIQARKRGALTGVTCAKGRLWLPYTVRLIVCITLPLAAVVFIALIVLCCVIKKRRKRAKRWRRRNVKLPSETGTNGLTRVEKTYESRGLAESPRESEISSSPPSTRRKPDGKLDSDSDDELTRAAVELHRQNTQRKAEELRRREMYNNSGGTGGLGSRPLMSRNYSDYTGLGQLESPHRDRQPLYGERRCNSIGNLQRPRAVEDSDTDDEGTHPTSRRVQRTKSASHSRTNLRSVERRRPPCPSQLYPPEYSQTPPRYGERDAYHDAEDPDLMFDDPRRGDRSRDYTPIRDLGQARSADPASRAQLPPLYGQRRCMSIENIRRTRPSGVQAKLKSLQGSKSVSHSRTSLRSIKRRAPQPPGHPPYQPLEQGTVPAGASNYVDNELTFANRGDSVRRDYSRHNTPNRSRAGSPTRSHLSNNLDSRRYPRTRHTPSHSSSNTPTRSRAASPAPRTSPAPRGSPACAVPSNSVNLSQNDIKKGTKESKSKPKYFNPYATRIPTKPKTSGSGGASAGNTGGGTSSAAAANDGVPKHEGRRYSDASVRDDSDHDLEDLEQVGIFGDVDSGVLDDGDHW